MLFNSLPFLYAFLPITYLVFRRLHSKAQRYVWLTITGYVFYSFWNPKFCALMAVSTLVSYAAGLGLLRWEDARRRKLCLVLPVTFDLAMLGVFKYAGFALGTANRLFEAAHMGVRAPVPDIVLPVGISFYTFHTITYIVDSWRGTIRPTRNFFEFSCYVSLFSQLVAGPIVRFREVEGDLERIDTPGRSGLMERGWSLFMIGMIKKVLLADTIARIIDPALLHWTTLTTADAWLCALGYTYQIYFDFSGYSDMAVGLGAMFGIRLPQNFNSPYQARDMADFWRRWHMSLSSVLRDYLYIPLGGSRKGEARTNANLMVTMLLGGLWHGANWTFVAWGGYHGALLVANRYWRGRRSAASAAATFLMVVVGWVLFRASTFGMAFGMLRTMFTFSPGLHMTAGWTLMAAIAIAGVVAHRGPNSFELKHEWKPASALALGVLFLACMVLIYGGQQTPFLYFQF